MKYICNCCLLLGLLGGLNFCTLSSALGLAETPSSKKVTDKAAGKSALQVPSSQSVVTKTEPKEPVTSDTYQLQPSDKVIFRIEEDPVPSRGQDQQVLNVTELHEVSFPVSRGSDIPIVINIRGKSLVEVKKELKTRLDSDFYNNATVHLRVIDKTMKPGKVHFYGQVRGEIDLLPGVSMTVTDALLKLNYDDFADLERITIYRVDPESKVNKSIKVDAKTVLKKGNRDKDVPLQDGDRIHVPEKRIF